MKNLCKKAGVVAIAMICAVLGASAQCRGISCGEMSLYAGFGGGATLIQDMSSPVFSVRLGMETNLVVAEIEGSYLSINSVYDEWGNSETNTLSTMTVGANIGLKFLKGNMGYLAVMLNTGYALQEDWYHHDPYWDYDYGHGHRYHGKYYIGAGLKGTVYISNKISLFGEARYQSIPVDGCGETKWGGVFQGGIAFHF